MTEDDDKALKELNEKLAQRKGALAQCTEDQFEEVMNFFEETAKAQQPFSSVGETPPVLSWEEMQNAFDENVDDSVRTFAKDIYEHWRVSREKSGNAAIHPALKLKIMDSTNDTDDNDPYVCFRRREVRQVRKTRGRDAQSVEKLKKLRRELEEARAIVALVRQREVNKKEQLAFERTLFEQRTALRKCKRTIGEPYNQGDEDLLINQKVGELRSLFPFCTDFNSHPRRSLLRSSRSPAPQTSQGPSQDRMAQLRSNNSSTSRSSVSRRKRTFFARSRTRSTSIRSGTKAMST